MSSSITPQANAPGAHVCTALCEGIASLPPQYHESVIAPLTQSLGQAPDSLRIENVSMTNGRIVPGQTRDVMPELDERRTIEGNTELARIPLALSTTYQYSIIATDRIIKSRHGNITLIK